MNFPIIQHIDDYRPFVQDKKYIIEQQKSNGCTIFCYAYSDSTFFKTPEELEARGIAFAPDGQIISRPFHKFFNVNEREESFFNNLDFSKFIGGFEKLDGSMIIGGIMPDSNEIFFQSKQSFESDVVIKAQEYVKNKSNYEDFIREVRTLNYTPIFEFTGPNNVIVLQYDDSCLTAIAFRHLFDGHYNYDLMRELCQKHDIPCNDIAISEINDSEAFFDKMKNESGYEGYVLAFSDGTMTKIKTQWYSELHRSVTNLRERDIAKTVLDDNLDDLYAVLNTYNYPLNTDRIKEIETTIHQKIESIQNQVDEFINYAKKHELSSKELAQKVLSENKILLPLVMNGFRGKSYDVVDFYEKNYLKSEWDLTFI